MKSVIKTFLKVTLWSALAFIFLIVLIIVSSPDVPSKPMEYDEVLEDNEKVERKKETEVGSKDLLKIEAYNFSKDLIKEYLKSPSTASFPRSNEIKLLALENDRYFIDGYVDSQNDFGATVRTQFECWVKYIRNQSIILESIDFK